MWESILNVRPRRVTYDTRLGQLTDTNTLDSGFNVLVHEAKGDSQN